MLYDRGRAWRALISVQRLDALLQEVICGIRILEPSTIHYANFREVFGLTGAEDRVLRGLLRGHVVEEISKIHRSSVATVRSQIKSIYAKTSVFIARSAAQQSQHVQGIGEPWRFSVFMNRSAAFLSRVLVM